MLLHLPEDQASDVLLYRCHILFLFSLATPRLSTGSVTHHCPSCIRALATTSRLFRGSSFTLSHSSPGTTRLVFVSYLSRLSYLHRTYNTQFRPKPSFVLLTAQFRCVLPAVLDTDGEGLSGHECGKHGRDGPVRELHCLFALILSFIILIFDRQNFKCALH